MDAQKIIRVADVYYHISFFNPERNKAILLGSVLGISVVVLGALGLIYGDSISANLQSASYAITGVGAFFLCSALSFLLYLVIKRSKAYAFLQRALERPRLFSLDGTHLLKQLPGLAGHYFGIGEKDGLLSLGPYCGLLVIHDQNRRPDIHLFVNTDERTVFENTLTYTRQYFENLLFNANSPIKSTPIIFTHKSSVNT